MFFSPYLVHSMNRIKMRNLLYLLTFVCTSLTSVTSGPHCKSLFSYYHTRHVTSQMGKRCKKLEKDGAQWKTKWEGANKALLDMAEDVSDVNLSYSFCLLKSYLFSSRLLFAKFKCTHHIGVGSHIDLAMSVCLELKVCVVHSSKSK